MKARFGLCLVFATAMAIPSYGALVSFPWAANGSGAEKNLDTILGMTRADIAGKQITTTDQTWSTAIGPQLASMIIEFAGDAPVNKFGVYEINSLGNKMEVFPGSASGGASAVLNISYDGMSGLYSLSVGSRSLTLAGGGTQFGFYIQNSTGFYYSNTSDNGGADQMVTYNIGDTKFNTGKAGWVLAFEDRPYGSSDKDFNDMVLSLTAAPVPESSTLIAGALLLLPFGASTIRFIRRNRAA
jgi:hypothetical protein